MVDLKEMIIILKEIKSNQLVQIDLDRTLIREVREVIRLQQV